MDSPTEQAPPPTTRGRPRRGWPARAVGIALVGIVVAAGYELVSGQAGVDFAVRELVARSGGALEIDGATGSLLDTVRIRRLAWRGPDASVGANDVALTWSPAALWSRGIVVRGLGVRSLTLDFKPSTTDVPAPESLALPFEIVIEHVGVGQLDWRVGASGGALRGLEFGYAGGETGHRLTGLAFVAPWGAIGGVASIGAVAPFAIAGRLDFRGDGALVGAAAGLELGGTLAAMSLAGSGESRAARFKGSATLAPLAAIPLKESTLDATDVDLAAWGAMLPTTRIAATVRAQPAEDGIAGTIEATNAIPGTIDGGRAPVTRLATRFEWRSGTLTLDRLVAQFPGGGTAAGVGRIPVESSGAAGAWSLEIRDADLKQFYTPLVATRLTGRLDVDLEERRQRVRGRLADRTFAGGITLDFDAVAAGDGIAVERFVARSGPGELAGRGRIALAGERAFDVDATAARFDPARFGDFPAGKLDGRIVATGALTAPWRARADISIAPGSRFAGVALAGSAKGNIAQEGLRDVAIDLAVGKGRLAATGNIGEADDRMRLSLETPELGELAAFLPPSFPRPLSGALRIKAEVRGRPEHAGVTGEARGENLTLGGSLALGALSLDVDVAPGTGSDPARDLAARKIRIGFAAKELRTPTGTFDTARADIAGTLAQHAVTLGLVLKEEDLDIAVAAHGGLVEAREGDRATSIAWNGTLDAFENRGAWALRLAAPASLELARAHVRIGETRLAVAEGNVHVLELAWDDGRIRTRGSFASVPLAVAARMAGRPLPFASTLTLGGDWSLTAEPRLNGTLAVRREGGDVWFRVGPATDPSFAAGITRLDADVRFTGDAVEGVAAFRSTRGGNADATLAVGALTGAPTGRPAPDAPLALALRGDLPSLQLLQPWIGTAFAIDGRAHIDLEARGTVANAPLYGTLVGENVRISAPQYGLHFTDGRFVGRAAGGRLLVEELTLRAGDGTFRASGEIGDLGPGGARPSGRLAWRAEKFRLFNRPDLRLVVGGEGTVTTRDGRLALAGKLRADEGRFVYLASAGATLSDDVVVKGWERRPADAARGGDLALDIDLALDLGENLTFSGEGLETGLVGEVRVTSGPNGLLGKGSIRAVNGTYYAFGQRLAVERGQLIFAGRLDNPALDIVALRRNQAVEAGVAVTGTVRSPLITLTSNPPVPDNEKLSWLVLGQGLDRTSGSDFAALQAASGALLGQQGRPVTTTIAQSFGLDDITFRSVTGTSRAAARGSPGAEGQTVAVWKRLTDRLSLVYEQGLTVATNALRLEYELTRSLALRAEAGTVSGFGIYFRRSFD